MSSMSFSSLKVAAQTPPTERNSGGNQRSCVVGGTPGKKKTTSASAPPSMAVDLPTLPLRTTRSTFRNVAPWISSTTSLTVCCTPETKARPHTRAWRSRYCWFSVDAKFFAGPSPAAGAASLARPRPGGGPSFAVAPAAPRPAAGHFGDADLRPTNLRPVTTKRSCSFAQKSRARMPAMLLNWMLNLAVNLAQSSLTSMLPVSEAFKICSNSSATEKGFKAVSLRTNATWLFSTWKPFCRRKKSCSFSPERPKHCSAWLTFTPCL
mmetsp:Transcript_19772/g.56560  ORF Transcript_19772/g.56560 Transcript_19772/m.56560 type:complete len:265 (-) Transcript_19772:471-1265(-)